MTAQATSSYPEASPLPSAAADKRSELGNVLVLGLGKSGAAVARYCLDLLGSRVKSVTVYGGAKSQASALTEELTSRGASCILGTEEVEGSYDLAIVSPGISEFSDFFAAARSHAEALIGEPEFAFQESPERWVGITGTNGKTTTTSLVGALLSEGGLPSRCVGNIGTLAISAVRERPANEWFACELSSYQLATTHTLHPRAAVLLNITPDHLSWHRSLEAYAAAKEKIFANLTPSDLAVVGEDEACTAISARLAARGLRVLTVRTQTSAAVTAADTNVAFVRSATSDATPEATIDAASDCAANTASANPAMADTSMLVVRLAGKDIELCTVGELKLKGEHNVQNALAAAAVALDLGVSASSVAATLKHFGALEHRIETCGATGGVTFVNDSKATNTDASQKALTAFARGSIVLLAGGSDKGTELGPWAADVCASCKAVISYGAAGPRLHEALAAAAAQTGSNVELLSAAHLSDAFELACRTAGAGNVVLLSPACASFDEFSGFEERGEAFKQLVSAYIAHAQGAEDGSHGSQH